MTTTSKFQVRPDYFSSPEECKIDKPINTNKRYRFFCQTHFTAGDLDQFEEYRDKTNGEEKPVKSLSLEKFNFWHKYSNLDINSVDNTFKYIFNKFKKGIFIKVKNRKLSVFLPFSKKNFVNEWSHLIHIEKESLYEFIEKLQKKENRKYNSKSVNKFIDTWFSNNCLLRWEFPINEGDTNIQCTSDLFNTLVREREIPDIEFFVNRRDFPLLKKDGTEAYDHIFGDDSKLLSHNYDKYSPILSMVGRNNYADIPMPTSEDWARVCRKENKYFPKTEKRDYTDYQIPWEKKKNIAVFRGSSTGAGVTMETNMRLKLAYLGALEENEKYIDVGITDWTLRPRKIKGEKYLKSIDIENMPFNLVQKLSQKEQQEYKYIINIDGHVAAYRLSMELSAGFCVLLSPSIYKLWYIHLLEPYVHYVPIKADLSDLIEKLKWCRNNDEKCRQIANNAREFSLKYLSKDGILDYLQKLLINLKNHIGTYVYPENAREKERKEMSLLIEKFKTNFKLESKEIIFENDHTKIYKSNNLCIKVSERDLVREAYIALEGTNKLQIDIPNFCYCHSYNDCLVTDYISETNLYQYIHSDQFDFLTFIHIFYQVALAIFTAQKKLNFIHWDLAPWNIMLKYEEKDIEYIIDEKTVYNVHTKIIPVIIDMGRSEIYKENYSSIQDILTLFNVCIYEIASYDNCDVDLLIKLCNFISNTTYRKKPFFKSGQSGLGEIRYFFGKAKKYSELIESNKYELENKTPLDFIKYLEKNFNIEKKVQNKYNKVYNSPLEKDIIKLMNSVFSEKADIISHEKLEYFYIMRDIIDRVYEKEKKYKEKYERCKKYIHKAITNVKIKFENKFDYEKLKLRKAL